MSIAEHRIPWQRQKQTGKQLFRLMCNWWWGRQDKQQQQQRRWGEMGRRRWWQVMKQCPKHSKNRCCMYDVWHVMKQPITSFYPRVYDFFSVNDVNEKIIKSRIYWDVKVEKVFFRKAPWQKSLPPLCRWQEFFVLFAWAHLVSSPSVLQSLREYNTIFYCSLHKLMLGSWKAFYIHSVISCDRRLTVIRRFSLVGLKSCEHF